MPACTDNLKEVHKMTNAIKVSRILQAMCETEELLAKATKRYNDSVTCLKMDIVENEELGNPKSANRSWVNYCNEDKARVKQLQAHMSKLKGMLETPTSEA